MSRKVKKQVQNAEVVTERQRHIMELRNKLNTPDPDEIRPFTMYKIITYLCVICFPLAPLGLYRIYCRKSEFTPKEQKIWTAVVVAIAAYAASMALS